MESTLGQFQTQQAGALDLLEKLDRFIEQGAKLGVSIDPSLLTKIRRASQQVANEKLKIALIGGFSEGKTAIAAAWMERLDKSSMHISQQESSNEVRVYEVDEDFVLIDTPGLFGFKEQYNTDSHAVERYKDITRRYVSEAHLVLYVMDSANPIKESHTDELKWLFRTLDLLPRTVFVLSRFDQIADIENEIDYKEKLGAKVSNVQGRLHDAIGASDDEIASLSIVAVAADPFELGTEHWLECLDQFRALSHIANLQRATLERIKDNGGALGVAEQARKSVIRDVLHKELPVAKDKDEQLGREVIRLKEMEQVLGEQLQIVGGRLSEARISLRDFIVRYFSDLILRTKGLTLKTCGEFFEREIGNEGIVVTTRLKNEFEGQLNGVGQELERIRLSFDSEIGHFNNTAVKLGKQGVNYVVKGNFINNTSILAARDGVVSVAKTLGMDVSGMLKFKPWGAVNLAKGVNGALVGLGFALDLLDSYQRYERQKEFDQSRVEMVKNFEGQRAELLDLLGNDDFVSRFFPDYAQLKSGIAEVSQAAARNEDLRKQFKLWRNAGEVIEGEFTVA